MKKIFFVFAALLLTVTPYVQSTHAGDISTADTKAFGKAMETITSLNPEMLMDAPKEMFGNYHCFHLTKGLGNMVHIAKDPSEYDADVVLLVQADPLIESGLKVEEFPQLTKAPYGPGLKSGQWYYIPESRLIILPLKMEDAGFGGSIIPKVK